MPRGRESLLEFLPVNDNFVPPGSRGLIQHAICALEGAPNLLFHKSDRREFKDIQMTISRVNPCPENSQLLRLLVVLISAYSKEIGMQPKKEDKERDTS